MRTSKITRRDRWRGLSLLEVALGLGLMSLGLIAGGRALNESAQAGRALSAAARLGEVSGAAADYVRTNRAALMAQTTPGGSPISIPAGRTTAGGALPVGPGGLPSLQGAGFLSSGFIDQNNYGQRHRLLVRQRAGGTLEFMVAQVGGRVIPDADLARVTQRMGATGGAAPTVPPPGIMPNVIVGTGGGWRATVAEWTATDGTGPTAGRAAVSNAFDPSNNLADYLYRNDIGIAEANRMRTALDMTGNDVNNGGIIRSQQNLMQNGGLACAGNASGCTFWISDDGGFMDLNDGWIRMVGGGGLSMGLAVQGPGNASLYVQNDASLGRDLFASRNAIVGAQLTVSGDGYFAQDLNIGQSLGVALDITSGRDIGTARDVYVGRDVAANRDVSAENSIRARNSVTAGQYVGSSLDMGAGRNLGVGGSAVIYGDANVGNTLWANYISARADLYAGGNISTPNGVWAAYMYTGNMDVGANLNVADSVALGGYLNVGQSATIGNGVGVGLGGVYTSGRVTAAAGLRTGLVASLGAGCAEEGLIARAGTGDGTLLVCDAGAWRASASGVIGRLYGGGGDWNSFACEAGYTIRWFHLNVGNSNNAFVPQCVRDGY